MRISAAVPLAALITLGCSVGNKPALPYQDPKSSIGRRVEDLFRRLTPNEKLALMRGEANQRLGIPAIHSDDGAGAKGDFPPGIAMAATWDPAVVGQAAQAIARDALAQGRDQLLASSVNGGEGYGEDPWLASRMTVAWVAAMQGEGEIATLRDFPVSRPDDAKLDDRTLNEIYFPPFRAAIEEAGAWSIMPAAQETPESAADVLEKDWGFKGFLAPWTSAGNVDEDRIRRLLFAMFVAGMFDRHGPVRPVDAQERRTAAWNATAESIVLLKNKADLLPVEAGKVHSIAVIGPALAVPDFIVNAIRARAGSAFQVEFAPGDSADSRQAATDLARKCDAAIVAGPDDLIQAIATANKNTIAILNSGSPTNGQWIDQVPALLSAWLAGPESGHALAAVIFGDIDPSGKLPVTLAKDSKAAQGEGVYVGYRYFDKHNIEPLFPFGYGLSYTTFVYSDLKIFPANPQYGQIVQVALKVKNTGSRAGAEVVQVYVHQVKSSVDRPVRELKAFKRVELKPGETREVALELDRHSMSFWDPLVRSWEAQPGVFEVLVGASSRDIRLNGTFELIQTF
ncbi:MAG: glycoside hydrolase family 3 C-terminal domain-containing protein [Bryobacteraceae bacterium]|jgi:beta-glucosidase